jgi:hypothetical protein
VSGQQNFPAALPPGKTRYHLYRKLGENGTENLIPPGYDHRTFQPVSSHYTDCVISAVTLM